MAKQAETKLHKQFEIPEIETVDSPFEKINDRWQVSEDIFSDFIKNKNGYRFGKNGEIEFGNVELPNVYLGGRAKTLKAGENIQNAIDALPDEGGTIFLEKGTHNINYDIVGKDQVSIIGAGKDLTILDFGSNAINMTFSGISSELIGNFEISNLTIKDADDTNGGLFISYSNFFIIKNVKITSCANDGLLLQRDTDFFVTDCFALSNGGSGFKIDGDVAGGGNYPRNFTFVNCKSNSNTLDGFEVDASTSSVSKFTWLQCTSESNSRYGFQVDGFASNEGTLIGCFANNVDINFYIDSAQQALIGCMGETATGSNYFIGNNTIRVIGCSADNSVSGTCYDFTGMDSNDECIFIGNTHTNNTLGATAGASMTDKIVHSMYNTTDSPRTIKKVYRVKNTSGGSLADGDVVIFQAAAVGDEVTTTTAQGDDFAFGMAMEAISDDGYGSVLMEGYTTKLKVDGTTDIAVGDYLGTFTTAKIAMKAAAGDMAFAIALEAYTTDDSSGVIDALLVTPRKI